MSKLSSRLTVSTAFACIVSPAFAHPSGHVQISWLEVVQHYTEPDHLALLALTMIVGWLAYRSGRRSEARVRIKPTKSDRS